MTLFSQFNNQKSNLIKTGKQYQEHSDKKHAITSGSGKYIWNPELSHRQRLPAILVGSW